MRLHHRHVRSVILDEEHSTKCANSSGERDDDWDPDFEEFDLPKSRKGKAGKDADEEEDFKIEEDDEFKDMDLFDDGGFDDDDDDF